MAITDSGLSPLHQISPREGQILRVSPLIQIVNAKSSYYHWHKRAFYRCNSPKEPDPKNPSLCCEKSARSWTCVSLALLYLNASPEGKLAKGAAIKFRIGYIGCAPQPWEQVKAALVKYPDGVDFLYTKDDYYNFEAVAHPPRWTASPQREEVIAAVAPWLDGVKLTEKLGKKLTDEEWRLLIEKGRTYLLEEEME
jgi:hypothetical protein